MKHYIFAVTVTIVVLGLYFNTEVTKEFISGFLSRFADIISVLSTK